MNRITLWDISNDDGDFEMHAYFDEEEIVLKGDDFGKAVRKAWGSDEYEYMYRFDVENTSKLFGLIAPDQSLKTETEKLQALAAWIGNDKNEQRLKKLCDDHHIEYSFSSYSSI